MRNEDCKFKGFFLDERNFISFKEMNPEELYTCIMNLFDAFEKISRGELVDSRATDLEGIPKITYIQVVDDIQRQYDAFIKKHNNLSRGQIMKNLPPELLGIKDLIEKFADGRKDFKGAVDAVVNTLTGNDRNLPVESMVEILEKAIRDGRGIVEAYGEWEIENSTPNTY